MSTPERDEATAAAAAECKAEVPPSNRVIDTLERVLPDMPMLGLFLLLLTLYLAATGGSLGPTSEELEAMRAASEAASASGVVAF